LPFLLDNKKWQAKNGETESFDNFQATRLDLPKKKKEEGNKK